MADEITRVPVVDEVPTSDVDIFIGPGMLKNFDPRKHLIKIGPKDYLQVMYRMVWLRDIDPQASVTTEMLFHDGDLAIFRAEVRMSEVGGGGSSVAHGSEDRKGFGDYIEKAETKAIGRALANLGFGTQFTAFELDTRVVDSPVDLQQNRARGQAVANQGSPASNRQNSPQTATQPQRQANVPQVNWQEAFVCDLRPPATAQQSRWDAVIDSAINESDIDKKKKSWGALRGLAVICCKNSPRNQDGVPDQNWRWYRIVANAPTPNYLKAIETAIEETAAWDDHLMELAKARHDDLAKKDFNSNVATFLPDATGADGEMPEMPY